MFKATIKMLVFLILSLALIWVSYHYVDKDVAWWIYSHHVSQYNVLKWFTYLSAIFSGLVVFIYIYVIARYLAHKINYFDRAMLALANSVVIVSYIKNILKIVFGRSWPLTWVRNNASLIKNNAYGFKFFHGTTPYSAFPSGHTAVIVALTTVLWFAYPRWRLLYILAALLVIAGLIGMNYHFVSDVVAGAVIGFLTGYFTLKLSGLHSSQRGSLKGVNNEHQCSKSYEQ